MQPGRVTSLSLRGNREQMHLQQPSPIRVPTGFSERHDSSLPRQQALSEARLWNLADLSRLDLATTMTLLLLLSSAPPYWYARIPLTALACAGVIFPDARRSGYLWLGAAAILFATNYFHWYSADNHKHLLAYWCLAIYLCLFTNSAEETLAAASRWLIGATFVFATFWKIYSPDFRSGAFFEYTLLLDGRFRSMTELIASLPASHFAANLEAMARLARVESPSTYEALRTTHVVPMLAKGMTYWTLAIESIVATAFVLPLKKPPFVRHVLLIVFVLSTYALAPVLGFGYLLICMGAAQTSADERRLRLAYACAFVAISTYATPWRQVYDAFGGGL